MKFFLRPSFLKKLFAHLKEPRVKTAGTLAAKRLYLWLHARFA